MKYEEKTLQTKRVYEGKIINLRVDTVSLPNGGTSLREIVEHPGGVGVLPLDGEGYVHLVRQFRKPYEEELLEIPAGKRDNKQEEPLTCGIRELREETGFTAGEMTDLGVLYPSVGYADEVLHIFLARNLTQGDTDPDEDEFVDVVKLPFSKAVDMAVSGELRDAKTVAALLKADYLLRHCDGVQ